MPCVALLRFCVLGSFRAYCVRIQGRYSSIVAAGKANRSPDRLRAGGKQSARPPDAPRPGCMTAGRAYVEAPEKDFVYVTELGTAQLQRHLRIRRQPVRRRQRLDYHQCGGCDQTRIAALLQGTIRPDHRQRVQQWTNLGAGPLYCPLGLGTFAPSVAGGEDFAYGGAETGTTPQNTSDPEILAISLPRRSWSSRRRCPSHHRTRSIHCRSDQTMCSTSWPAPA
jgi:hypothetical protein